MGFCLLTGYFTHAHEATCFSVSTFQIYLELLERRYGVKTKLKHTAKGWIERFNCKLQGQRNMRNKSVETWDGRIGHLS